MSEYFVIDAGTCQPEKRSWSQYNGVLTWSSSDVRDNTARVVTEHDTLSYSPVFSGISLIAGDISSMPWETKRKDGDDLQDATDHSTRGLLLRRTGDDDFTSNLFVEALVGRALFYGLGAARIHRGGPLLRPNRLELIRKPVQPVDRLSSGRKYRFYEYTDDAGNFHQVRPQDMFVLNGPSIDAFHGMGLYGYARRVIGRAIASSDYADEFFTGGSVPQGWFVHPGEMGDTAQERFFSNIQRFKNRQFGILEEDMKWVPSGVDPKDAMLVEVLNLSAVDVARYLKLPPGKLGIAADDGGKAPAKSVEQEQKNYLASCLMYWINRLEREADDKLFREDEKEAYYTCFDTRKFVAMTATLKEQSEADQLDVMSGTRLIDEVRKSRGLNPHAGGVGAKPLLPLNMTTNPANLNQATGGEAPPAADPPAEGDDDPPARNRVQLAKRDVVRQAISRMSDRLANAMQRQARKRNANFLEALDQLSATHRKVITDALTPALTLIAYDREVDNVDQFVSDTVDNLLSQSHRIFLQAAECPADELATRVEQAATQLHTAGLTLADGFFEGE